MKLFSRIALAIAILACISACFFASQLGANRNSLRAEKDSLIADKAKLDKDVAAARTELATTKQEWEKTKEDLTTTQGALASSKVTLATKTQEADTLKAALSGKAAELDQAKAERDTAQQAIKNFDDSLKKAGLDDIGKVDQLREKITTLSEENQILGQQLGSARTESAALKQQLVELSTTPANLRGRIAAVQDSWGFVVIDVGRDQRVQTNADFIVSRGDKMVAKVHVRKVGENTSVAEILPGFPKNQPQVGDTVVHD